MSIPKIKRVAHPLEPHRVFDDAKDRIGSKLGVGFSVLKANMFQTLFHWSKI